MSNISGRVPPKPPMKPAEPMRSAVWKTLLGVVAGGLLLLALGVGFLELGFLTLATDSCGSEHTCSTTATVAMMAFSGGGPILVLVVVAILAIISRARKSSGPGAVVTIMWCGVLADILCIVASYLAAGAIAPS